MYATTRLLPSINGLLSSPKRSQAKQPRPTLLVDLDGVLVRPDFLQSVPHRIARFAVENLGYDVNTAQFRCRTEYAAHGTNLEGFFVNGFGTHIDIDDYHEFIHGHLPYHTIPKAPREFRKALQQYKCILFTNADLRHSIRCIEALGLDSAFSDIVCFETMQKYKHDALPGTFVIKPKDTAIRAALGLARVPRDELVFFDDSLSNVHMGLRNGVRSILVSNKFDPVSISSVGAFVADIHHFEHVL